MEIQAFIADNLQFWPNLDNFKKDWKIYVIQTYKAYKETGQIE